MTTGPEVDDGGPGGAATVLALALAPSWSRLRSTLLVLVPMLAVLAIGETFRLPELAIACFVLLLMARGDAISTLSSSVPTALSVCLGALIAIAALALSLSEPALRIPLMAGMTFATMLAVRATTLGPVAFVVGFYATYGTTQADNLSGLAMSPDTITNTEGFGRPAIDFFPPEEALLHALLWLVVAALLPLLLLLLANRLAGADPRDLLVGRFRARLDAAFGFCRGEAGAGARLRVLGREGIAPMLDLVSLTERSRGTAALHDAHVRLIRALGQLILLLAAWDAAREIAPCAEGDDAPRRFLDRVGTVLDRVRAQLDLKSPSDGSDLVLPPEASEVRLEGAFAALAPEIRTVLHAASSAEADRNASLRPGTRPDAAPRAGLFRPHPLAAPNVRFALKVTLAVMISYLIEIGLDWTAISSCVVACFTVAIGTTGENIHKMTLRLAGALIGGGLGIGVILLLMPSMTDLGDLELVFGTVAFLAAWISFGSPRISYAGWQILLAFALTTLQGYGPTLDMQVARDRVIGIVLGNVVAALVFVFVWPERVDEAIRADLGAAFETLGAIIALEGSVPNEAVAAREAALRDSFVARIGHIGQLMPNDRFEPAPAKAHPSGRIGRTALARLSRLIVPVSAIATDRIEDGAASDIPDAARAATGTFQREMAAWFGAAGDWMRTGAGAEGLRAALPAPPPSAWARSSASPELARRLHGRAALFVLLERFVDEFLDAAVPGGVEAGAVASRRTGGAHAVG